MTYINGVADLMQKNCEFANQRLSAGGLSNADDRRAMLSVSSDARAVYVTAGGMHECWWSPRDAVSVVGCKSGLCNSRRHARLHRLGKRKSQALESTDGGRCHGCPSRKMAV
jgi:hypothetical protein